MKTMRATMASVAAVTAVMLAGQNEAAAVPVDLELQLLVDVSGSVDSSEFTLQRDAYAQAFQDPAIQNAIFSGGTENAIAAQLIYWSEGQTVAVDWTLISNASEADAFGTAVGNTARPSGIGNGTGIAGAIDFGVSEFAFGGDNGFESNNQIMDISGDGIENDAGAEGSSAANQAVRDSRDAAIAAGVERINGLPILNDFTTLDDYYSNNVIGGIDAFLVAAASFQDFETALEQKLVGEITGEPPNTEIPLPASMVMLLSALGGLGFLGRRRNAV